jgi:hypothetical protein
MTAEKQAVALFFDEVRSETQNKFSLMGQYVGELILVDPIATPVDRLGVVVHARWPPELRPQILSLQIVLPRQEPLELDLAVSLSHSERSGPASPFSRRIFQTSMNLRFAPLQPGDVIDVWLTIDGDKIPAGRLAIRSQTRPETVNQKG